MLNNLVSTPMLRPHQKLIIINQYLWPTIIYPLQTAPLHKLPKSFLMNVDKIIRSAVKEILGIPTDTPNGMLYSSSCKRGLSITKAEWEAYLQHYNICEVLLRANDMYVPASKDIDAEMKVCENELNFTEEELSEFNNSNAKSKITKRMRKKLRDKEFENWSKLKLRGIGVTQFEDNPSGNKKLIAKDGLTTTEYVTSLKMNANVTSVRAIPGRSLDGSQCRYCTEKETLGHVLGRCSRGELIRNKRHNDCRAKIAKAMKDVGFQIAEEVHGIAKQGSTRRIDIIAYDAATREGFILDPTVRFENGTSEAQSLDVDKEKKEIYEPCIEFYKKKYNLDTIEVIGLYIGARGTITSQFKEFVSRFMLLCTLPDDIMLTSLRGSIQIYNHHLYGS
jgi:hypothetical protein